MEKPPKMCLPISCQDMFNPVGAIKNYCWPDKYNVSLIYKKGGRPMRKANVIWLIILVLFLAGCAFGNKHAYHNVDANISAAGTTKVAVATHDQRNYVKNGDKQPDFVGLQRGGFGNPFDITTASGNALAQDVTETICRSLASKGFHTTPVIVNYSETSYTVKADLKKTGANLFHTTYA